MKLGREKISGNNRQNARCGVCGRLIIIGLELNAADAIGFSAGLLDIIQRMAKRMQRQQQCLQQDE